MNEKNYYLERANGFGWGPKTAKINFERAKLIETHVSGRRILDIGCGSGIWVDYFARRGYQATGVDFVKSFIVQAKEKYQGNFVVATADKLPFAANSFDTALMISSLEHIDREKAAVSEAGRVAKRLIIIVPQKTPDVLIRRGVVFKHHLDRTHKRVYTERKITQLFAKTGFKIRKTLELERLPAISILPELFTAPRLIKRIVTRLFFWIFNEKNYYLELMAVADKK